MSDAFIGDEESDSHYHMVMPFVVCDDNGGPYKVDAFVAGCYFGELSTLVRLLPCGTTIQRYIPTSLLPQVDLLVMQHGAYVRTIEFDEAPDEWIYVEIQQVPFEEYEDDV